MLVPPAIMWVSCLGCGLALERLLGVRLSNALLLALGLCVSLIVIFPGYAAGAGDVLAVALLGAVTLAGLIFARGGILARLNPGWPAVAGGAAYVLYMLPVIAYGHWTWSGYGFVNDSGFEMLLAQHVKAFGATLGNIPQSTAREFLKEYLATGYPLGSLAQLGTYSGLSGASVGVLYQGYISALAGIGALALATITTRVLTPRRAAFAGFVAMSANLTYQYALQGGIKEIGLLATVCAAVALARAAITLERPYASAALVAVAGAGALTMYNAVAIPYLGALVLLLVVGASLVHRRFDPRRWRISKWIGPVAVGLGLTALLAIPTLLTFKTFFSTAQVGQGSTGVGATQYGQLLRALPLSQVSGVWLVGEYRLPVPLEPAALLTLLATVTLFVLLIPGVLYALHRREAGPLLMLGTMGVVLLIVFPRVSPYAQGKLLAIAAPAVVLVALTALGSVRGRLAPVALLAGGTLALAVVASDILAYGWDRVAPSGQVEAIEKVGERFRGKGPVLWNEFQEYAKVFAGAALIYSPFEALTPEQVQLRSPTYFYGHDFDLDQELLAFVERYPIIVMRRSPAASRPPANYQLVYENAYYLAWQRASTPQVLGHLPEQQTYSATATVACSALRDLVSRAPTGAELVAAEEPVLHSYEPLYSPDRSFGWGLVPGQPGAVRAATPGHAAGTLSVPASGRYDLWIQGDFPRRIYAYVDGRRVGSVAGTNTPNQWLQAGSVYLRAGPHNLRVLREGGRRHFGPQEWGIGTIGAVGLQIAGARERLMTVPVRRWHSLCGTQADWVELVRP
ncbi:MAG: carbohydrate-binding protein [Solirubrobacteraceae bacterium]